MLRIAPRPLVVLFACALAAVVLVGAAQTRAQSSPLYWTQAATDIPPTVNLTTAYLLNGSDNVWVGGQAGVAGMALRLQRQGDRWVTIQQASLRAPVRSLVAIADDNVWAVGDQGVIAHRDASGWHEMSSPASAADLTTIQMFGKGEEGWAGGTFHRPGQQPTAVLLHYVNGTWQAQSPLTGYGSINSLHFADGMGWAVGQVYAPDSPVVHFSGGAWQAQSSGLCGTSNLCNNELTGVRALGADNAWAVGIGAPGHGPPGRWSLILHWTGAQWQDLDTSTLTIPPPNGWVLASWLDGVSFSDAAHGLAVGGQLVGQTMTGPVFPFALSYQADGQWHVENLPYVQGELHAVSQADATHALAVGDGGLILTYGYGGAAPGPWPTPTPYYPPPPAPEPTPWPPTVRVPDPHLPNVLYFPLVGHSLQGGFRAYWEAHGGLAQFGYPLTEEFQMPAPGSVGPNYTMQYFERARFEWHPENRPPYDVLLGQLGRELTQGRQFEAPFLPHAAQSSPGTVYFRETQHNLAAEFAGYWREHGGLAVYGYPISEGFTEVSKTDGKPYLVQYFERNRFEYHPELPEAFRVSLGLLGVDQLRAGGWLP